MRIFTAVEASPNAKGLAQSRAWERNLIHPLQDLGHEVIPFHFDLQPFSVHANPAYEEDRAWQEIYRPKLEEALLCQIRDTHKKLGVDLFFSYFWDAHVTPGTIQEIRKMGIPTLNFFSNGSFQLYMVEKIAPAYDYNIMTESFRIDDYKRIGARPIYIPFAANPDFYRPHDLPRDIDISFLGQCYGDRVDFVHRIWSAGLKIEVFGPQWCERAHKENTLKKRMGRIEPFRTFRKALRECRGKVFKERKPVPPGIAHPPIDDEAMIRLFSQSKINLGFSTCGDTDAASERIVQIRLRDVEVPMSGGFYLVERFDELATMFEYGKEIEGYSSADELLDKCRYYLKHEAERECIRKAGYERALRDHTWTRRFVYIFDQMGLK